MGRRDRVAGPELARCGELVAQALDFGEESRVLRSLRMRRTGDLRRQLPRRRRLRHRARRVDHVAAQVERLRGGVELQAQHLAQVVGHCQHVARFVGAHGHVVFRVRAGRNRVHRRRHRAAGEVVDDGRRRVLHDHEARFGGVFVADQEGRQPVVGRRIHQLVEPAFGNARQHGNRGFHVAHRQRERHAVEMAGGNDLLFDVVGLCVREHDGIVGKRVQFDLEHAPSLRQRVAHGTVHLRHAAQRVAVLRLVLLAAAKGAESRVELLSTVALRSRHPVPTDVEAQLACVRACPALRKPGAKARDEVVGDVGQCGAVEQLSQVRGHRHLAGMRPQRVDLGRERAEAACEGVDGHRGREIGRVDQILELRQGEHARREHLRSAVVEREAFLVRERDRRQAGPRERVGAGDAFACEEGFAATEQHDGQVRQRREIATGADRPELRHHRHDPGVEHRHQRLQRFHAHAGMPAHQRVDADAQHRPHHFGRERFTHADRMGDDEVVLQFGVQRLMRIDRVRAAALAHAIGAEQAVGIAAETGGHAVDGLLARDLFGEEIRRARHGRQLRLVQFHRCTVGDGEHLRARERAPVEMHRLHARTAGCASSTRSVAASSERSTWNWSSRRRSFTVTLPAAISSSPSTTTKRMPARSA